MSDPEQPERVEFTSSHEFCAALSDFLSQPSADTDVFDAIFKYKPINEIVPDENGNTDTRDLLKEVIFLIRDNTGYQWKIQHYTDNLGRGTYRCTQDYDYNCSGKLILTTEKVRVRQVRLAVHVEHDYGHPSHDHEGNADSDDEPGPQLRTRRNASSTTSSPAKSKSTPTKPRSVPFDPRRPCSDCGKPGPRSGDNATLRCDLCREAHNKKQKKSSKKSGNSTTAAAAVPKAEATKPCRICQLPIPLSHETRACEECLLKEREKKRRRRQSKHRGRAPKTVDPPKPFEARQPVFFVLDSSSDEDQDVHNHSDDEVGSIEDCDTGSPPPQQTSSKPRSTNNPRKRARRVEDEESTEEEAPQTNRQRTDVESTATRSVVDFLDGAIVGCVVC